MCLTNPCKRDKTQVSALLWRIRKVLWRDKMNICKVFTFPLVVITLILSALVTYSPADLQLSAVKSAYVTSSTPNATTNNFYDDQSGFNTPLVLKNCTLYEYFNIGVVKTGGPGDAVLDSIFTELNDAYASAYNDKFSMSQMDFDSWDDMASYVQRTDYRDNGLCFAISWATFDTTSHTYSIDISHNFGNLFETRNIQTSWEDSLYNQGFLSKYANYGFL